MNKRDFSVQELNENLTVGVSALFFYSFTFVIKFIYWITKYNTT